MSKAEEIREWATKQKLERPYPHLVIADYWIDFDDGLCLPMQAMFPEWAEPYMKPKEGTGIVRFTVSEVPAEPPASLRAWRDARRGLSLLRSAPTGQPSQGHRPA